MTRIYSLPTTQLAQEHTYTAQEDELRRIRHRLTLAAARVGMRGVTVAQSAAEVEAIRQQLSDITREAQQAK